MSHSLNCPFLPSSPPPPSPPPRLSLPFSRLSPDVLNYFIRYYSPPTTVDRTHSIRQPPPFHSIPFGHIVAGLSPNLFTFFRGPLSPFPRGWEWKSLRCRDSFQNDWFFSSSSSSSSLSSFFPSPEKRKMTRWFSLFLFLFLVFDWMYIYNVRVWDMIHEWFLDFFFLEKVK